MCQAGGHLFQINLFIFLVWLPQRGIDGAIYLRKTRAGEEREREIIYFYPQLCAMGGCRLVLQLTSPLPFTVTPSPGHVRQTINQPIKEKTLRLSVRLIGLHLHLSFNCALQIL